MSTSHFKTNYNCLVDGSNTCIGAALLIWLKTFPYIPIIIYIEEKLWTLNLLDLFFQRLLPTCPNHLFVMVFGRKNMDVSTVILLISYGVDTSIPYRKPHSTFSFSAASYFLRNWGTRDFDWNFCNIWVIKWCKLCVVLKYAIPVDKGF